MALKTAIGLMSGTSMDGIDAALVRTDGEYVVERGPNAFFPYRPEYRKKLEQVLDAAKTLTDRGQRPGILSEVEKSLDELHAEAVAQFLDGNSLDVNEVDVIGYHGQTVLHRPENALTVQIGRGGHLAHSTGISVVYDMRANDMVHGGQGAPLAPAYHAALAYSLPEPYRDRFPVAFVNIGGIGNITWIAPGADPVAFDTGPGNALIDQWVQTHAGIPFDDGGRVGSEGSVDRAVVEKYLSDPFFEKPAPKSLDRFDFSPEEAAGLELSDGARTLAAVTAESVYAAIDHVDERPKLWILSGGGRKNASIVEGLTELAENDDAVVIAAEEAGLDGDAMEAEAWAYLAVRSFKGLPLTWPTTTGCRKAVTGGVLVKP